MTKQAENDELQPTHDQAVEGHPVNRPELEPMDEGYARWLRADRALRRQRRFTALESRT